MLLLNYKVGLLLKKLLQWDLLDNLLLGGSLLLWHLFNGVLLLRKERELRLILWSAAWFTHWLIERKRRGFIILANILSKPWERSLCRHRHIRLTEYFLDYSHFLLLKILVLLCLLDHFFKLIDMSMRIHLLIILAVALRPRGFFDFLRFLIHFVLESSLRLLNHLLLYSDSCRLFTFESFFFDRCVVFPQHFQLFFHLVWEFSVLCNKPLRMGLLNVILEGGVTAEVFGAEAAWKRFQLHVDALSVIF